MNLLLPSELDADPGLDMACLPHRSIVTPFLDRECRRTAAEVLCDPRCPVCSAPMHLRHGHWGPNYFCRCTRFK